MIRPNARQILTENYEASSCESLKEYVKSEAESGPGFYRRLFDEDFPNDFDADLTDVQKLEYEEFFNSL